LAVRWEDELSGLLHRLSQFPHSAQVREEFAPAPVRVAAMGQFLVFYDPSRTPLHVLRVLRASRNDVAALKFSRESHD
jgi:plasmid stabilization system protein ParE